MADDSFFLYGMGERPEALTLGSLVLEKYWQPMSARHYTHELLRYYMVHRLWRCCCHPGIQIESDSLPAATLCVSMLTLPMLPTPSSTALPVLRPLSASKLAISLTFVSLITRILNESLQPRGVPESYSKSTFHSNPDLFSFLACD